MRFCAIFLATFLYFVGILAIPIETPNVDQRNNFVIRCPEGWGYRTFRGSNGLIGVMWPIGTSYNLTDTVIFIFLQDDNMPIPRVPCNYNLFTEKCTKAEFRFSKKTEINDPTLSLGEKYFRGRCGKTMIIFKVAAANYNIIIMVASSKYVTKTQLEDIKKVAENYKAEAQKYVSRMKAMEAFTNSGKKNNDRNGSTKSNGDDSAKSEDDSNEDEESSDEDSTTTSDDSKSDNNT